MHIVESNVAAYASETLLTQLKYISSNNCTEWTQIM